MSISIILFSLGMMIALFLGIIGILEIREKISVSHNMNAFFKLLLGISFILIVMGLLMSSDDKFDPKNDVCLQWQRDTHFINDDEVITFEELSKEGNYYILTLNGNKPFTIGNKIMAKCVDWREKTYCEREENMNDNEKCVCDEYDQEKKEMTTTYFFNSNLFYVEGVEYKISIEDNNTFLKIGHWVINRDTDELVLKKEYITFDKIKNNISMEQSGDYIRVVEHRGTNIINTTCIKAHEIQKPIKIDLDNEKCVEHTFEYSNNREDCSVFQSDEDLIGINVKYMWDEYCCLKKEKKNECEKGNTKYTMDTEKICDKFDTKEMVQVTAHYVVLLEDLQAMNKVDKLYYFESKVGEDIINAEIPLFYEGDSHSFLDSIEVTNATINGNCLHYEYINKTCRKKTIYDYDCKRLKEAIIFDGGYDTQKNMFTDYISAFCGPDFRMLCKHDIIKVFKEKGCEL